MLLDRLGVTSRIVRSVGGCLMSGLGHIMILG